MVVSSLVLLSLVATVVAMDECSCAALEKEVRALRSEMGEMWSLVNELRAGTGKNFERVTYERYAEHRKEPANAQKESVHAAVPPAGRLLSTSVDDLSTEVEALKLRVTAVEGMPASDRPGTWLGRGSWYGQLGTNGEVTLAARVSIAGDVDVDGNAQVQALNVLGDTSANNLHVNGSLTLAGVDVGAALVPATCIRITTGDGSYSGSASGDAGYLKVYVWDAASGTGFSTTDLGNGQLHGTNSVVVNHCFAGFRALRVQNSHTDGWLGTVMASTDGGSIYRPMLCVQGSNGQSCKGPFMIASHVGADLEAMTCGSGGGLTCCQNGDACTFVVL